MFTVGFIFDNGEVSIPGSAYLAGAAFAAGVVLSNTSIPDKTERLSGLVTAALSVTSAFLFGAAVGSGVREWRKSRQDRADDGYAEEQGEPEIEFTDPSAV